MSKYSKKAQAAIGRKMHVMKGEDKPQAQKVAIAMSEARRKGLKVPKENPHGMHDNPASMEKQGKDMAVLPKKGEPEHHIGIANKSLKQRISDYKEKDVYKSKQIHSAEFLKHPQIKMAPKRK